MIAFLLSIALLFALFGERELAMMILIVGVIMMCKKWTP